MAYYSRPSFWEDDEWIRYQCEVSIRSNRPRLRNVIYAYDIQDAIFWWDSLIGDVLAHDRDTNEMLVQDPSGKVHTFEVVTNERSLRGARNIRILLVTRRMEYDGFINPITTRQEWHKHTIDQGLLNFGWFVREYARTLSDTTNTHEPSYYDIRFDI